jgi:hypothetical protein
MSKSYFFFGFVPTHPEDKKRVSATRDYKVQGGSKERHEKTVEIVQEISKEFKKDPPQTPGEERMILLDVVKRIG